MGQTVVSAALRGAPSFREQRAVLRSGRARTGFEPTFLYSSFGSVGSLQVSHLPIPRWAHLSSRLRETTIFVNVGLEVGGNHRFDSTCILKVQDLLSRWKPAFRPDSGHRKAL